MAHGKSGPPETGEAGRLFKAAFIGRKPIPITSIHPAMETSNGKVRITTPADPEKIKAYHATASYKRWQKSRDSTMKRSYFNGYPKEVNMGKVKDRLMQDQEDGLVEEED